MNNSETEKWKEIPFEGGKRQFAVGGNTNLGSIIIIKHPGDKMNEGKDWLETNIQTPNGKYVNVENNQDTNEVLRSLGLPPLEQIEEVRESVAALKIERLSY